MNVSIQTDELTVRGEMKVLGGESAGHHLSASPLALVFPLQENWIRHGGGLGTKLWISMDRIP